jgi:hypothetical protein
MKKIENLMRNWSILLSEKLQNVSCVATLSWLIRHMWRLATWLLTLGQYILAVTTSEPHISAVIPFLRFKQL